MTAKTLRTHVLYESSHREIPHGCSEIRLLRPLAHSTVRNEISLTHGSKFPSQTPDVLIIERLWDGSCDWRRHLPYLQEIRRQGCKIIFEIDDDLLSLNSEAGARKFPSDTQQMWLRQVARFADGVIVSTHQLASRLASLNPNIEVVPNALDESLFDRSQKFLSSQRQEGPVVIGYMGTFTHLDDLISIIQPLRSTLARFKDSVRLEIVGVGDSAILKSIFSDLQVRLIQVPSQSVSYCKFSEWMQKYLRWDFGIAPLFDSAFSQSKSDIKFLDYAVQGIPGVFSNVPAYNQTIKHMENGLLADTSASWADALSRLVLEDQLRVSLAKQAHDYVWRERILKTEAAKWLHAIKKISLQSHKIYRSILPSSEISPPLSRNEKVLFGCDLQGIGLEIGASYSPVAPKKAGYRVEVLDHADAKTLRQKYQAQQGVNVENIEEVDHVWTGEPLHELTGRENYYDWVIASHVVEHTPDLVSFLKQCELMLKPGGILSLGIPDHRYCFDVFRPASTPGDVIQAFLEKRRRHCPGTIWDHFSMFAKKGDSISWGKGFPGAYAPFHATLDDARAMLSHAQETSEYLDVHNWRFTPSSFKLIVMDIASLGYVNLAVKSFFTTEGCEFIVQLMKVDAKENAANLSLEREELLLQMLNESLELK
jgi:glycosyltransferase involved in cell wall biosynthesis/SAM-dependent methyltransferase